MPLFNKATTSSVIDKIKSFSALPTGWHYGEGAPADQTIIDVALEVLDYAFSQGLLVDAAPGIEGDLQLAVYPDIENKNTYIEATIYRQRYFNITRYDLERGKWEIKEDIDFANKSDLLEYIRAYGQEYDRWRFLLESYLKDVSIRNWVDLAAKPSKTIKAQYLLFATTVCCLPPQRSVNTWSFSTTPLTPLPSYIGYSTTESSPPIAIGTKRTASLGMNAITIYQT